MVGAVPLAVRADAVERAGDDARGGGLAHAAHAGEHEGMGDAAGGEGVGQRAHQRLLPDQAGEVAGAGICAPGPDRAQRRPRELARWRRGVEAQTWFLALVHRVSALSEYRRRLADDPKLGSLRLLPSGPDRVGERFVRRQPPGALYQGQGPARQVRIATLTYCPARNYWGSNVRLCRQSAGPRQREAVRCRVACCRTGGPGLAGAAAVEAAAAAARVRRTRRARPSSAFVDGAMASGLGAPDAAEVFLGLDGTTAYFARDISALPDPLAAALAGLGHFRDARAAASLLPLHQVAIMGQAKALLDWHMRHGFCSQCGTATLASEGGYRRVCPVLQERAFSAHRSGGDHAGDDAGPLSAGAQQAVCRRALLDARRLRRAGRDDRRGGHARGVRGGRACG